MNDPFNQLPTDADWVRKSDELAEAAAKELGCMVLMIAIQEHGKLGMGLSGVPDSGPLADLAKDVPGMLLTMARTLWEMEQHDKGKTRQ